MLSKNSKMLNRSTSDVSWYEFGRQLEYKSIWNSKYFCKVDQYFPSTQICSKCNSKAHLSLKDRMYLCPNCKIHLDRDYNASLNLHKEGIRILSELLNKKINTSKSCTAAAAGINACGLGSIESRLKQEKRKFQQPSMVVA